MAKEYLGTVELANALRDQMEAVPELRTRGNATDVPTERTIRYYLQKRMIPPPLGKRGVNLRFGRIHLLALLAIKRLQALGVVNNAGIRELIADKNESELEELLKEEVKAVTDPAEIDRYRSMSGDELEREFGTSVTRVDLTRAGNAAKEFFEKRLFPSRASDDDVPGVLFSRAHRPSPLLKAAVDPRSRHRSWERHELADGIEIHIRNDTTVPLTRAEGEKILHKIMRLLGLDKPVRSRQEEKENDTTQD